MLRMVTMGGGTGQYALLTGLKTIPDFDITAIVTMADSGGSSGVLRTERGVLPPGDILRCLLALATADEDVVRLFEHRLAAGGGIGGHTIGNIALTGAAEQQSSFLDGIATLGKILALRGNVLPVTLDQVELRGRRADGTRINGEHTFGQRDAARITDVWLEPNAKPLREAIASIRSADAIVAGPGSLWTSIIPNLLVEGVADAVRACHGPLIVVVNAMTEAGETDRFRASDFVEELERYAKRTADTVICNTRRPAADVLAKYECEGAQWVPPPSDLAWGGRTIVPFPLLSDGPFARHDSERLAHVIRALC